MLSGSLMLLAAIASMTVATPETTTARPASTRKGHTNQRPAFSGDIFDTYFSMASTMSGSTALREPRSAPPGA